MPTFDFQCQDCNCVFEHNRPFGSKEIPHCPECKGHKVEKLIAPPTIHFKGEGFYKTDSSAKPEKEEEKEVKKEDQKDLKDKKEIKDKKETKKSDSNKAS